MLSCECHLGCNEIEFGADTSPIERTRRTESFPQVSARRGTTVLGAKLARCRRKTFQNPLFSRFFNDAHENRTKPNRPRTSTTAAVLIVSSPSWQDLRTAAGPRTLPKDHQNFWAAAADAASPLHVQTPELTHCSNIINSFAKSRKSMQQWKIGQHCWPDELRHPGDEKLQRALFLQPQAIFAPHPFQVIPIDDIFSMVNFLVLIIKRARPHPSVLHS